MSSKRINLWSGPRNISTALMYSFAQREDTRVLDEPLYAFYLAETGLQHPGRKEILASQSNNGQEIIDRVILRDYAEEVVFFKQMTHHLLNLDRSFLNSCKNIILIRHPKLVLQSYAKVIANPSVEDIGIVQSFRLVEEFQNSTTKPIIIDSDGLLQNPADSLAKLCEALQIPYDEKMLNWNPGPRIEDGVWASYWYSAVHNSRGFHPAKSLDFELPENLHPILNEALPFYDSLKEIALI